MAEWSGPEIAGRGKAGGREEVVAVESTLDAGGVPGRAGILAALEQPGGLDFDRAQRWPKVGRSVVRSA